MSEQYPQKAAYHHLKSYDGTRYVILECGHWVFPPPGKQTETYGCPRCFATRHMRAEREDALEALEEIARSCQAAMMARGVPSLVLEYLEQVQAIAAKARQRQGAQRPGEAAS